MFGRKKRTVPQQHRKPKPAPKPAVTSRVKASLLSLESRLMFDAAAMETAAEVNIEQVAQAQADAAVSSPATSDGATQETSDSQALLDAFATYLPTESRTEIVFVDPTVPNYRELLTGMDSNLEVILLDGGQDGVEQMASALAGRTGIDAVHVISHGDAGALQLGTGTLNAETMSGQYADELATIKQALSEQADILVYGCDFAEGDVGQAAVNQLASLTGADVQASTDLTGNVALGGDWDLESATGTIETLIAIDAQIQREWSGVLSGSAPTATDDAYSVSGWGTINVGAPGLMSNDSDPEGDALSAYLVSGPSNGSLSLNSDGSFIAKPTIIDSLSRCRRGWLGPDTRGAS